ncbi:exodeoxyribonuclease VII large subunit [Metallumcola ferriviriculae]|uniref:Exodeoxyribonuclease 7 large subunit n=1 Tax=Metallumcola ferriviriculae TaxID=3039180 RepID=A0AAU0UT98_9FIRM|nr:exodeoxyribonuclease VII large subunit [Desulfitibacteraceae bacterium MK1]
MQNKRIVTVSQLNNYLKSLLEADPNLTGLWLKGEISNFKHHNSGHMYFTLKDNSGSMRCVMFKGRNSRLAFRPENGMQVLANGYVSVYPQGGQYQFYVQDMEPHGYGSLYAAFEQLKSKLEAEGLFAAADKKAIPVLPRKIGIVTSISGAALRDIIHVIRRRFPRVELILSPAAVQGWEAPAAIARALDMLNRHTDVDAIIMGRGGGSLEELWSFNTEVVARAVYQSVIPVISAVGHETDFTISDFVADKRAPTPSAAAELAVPNYQELEAGLFTLSRRLHQAVEGKLRTEKQRLAYLSQRKVFQSPQTLFQDKHQTIDLLAKDLGRSMQKLLSERQIHFARLAADLDAYSPLKVLGRGYSICRKSDGTVITEAVQLLPGQKVEVLLTRGAVDCTIEKVKEELPWQKPKT